MDHESGLQCSSTVDLPIRLLPLMDVEMVVQRLFGLELLAAQVALELALRIVGGHVPLQLPAVPEHLLAHVALVPVIKRLL